MSASLYRGKVRHSRLRPVRHNLTYRVFYGMWDVDRLDTLDRSLRFFSVDRFNLYSFHRRDHGAEDETPLRVWADGLLREAGVNESPARIEILAHPRILGYVFNPISVWYCYDNSDRLIAVIHEVRNTFGDKHCYVAPINMDRPGHLFRKQLHVSPFNDMDSTYEFSLNVPEARLTFSISQSDGDGVFLRAGMALTRLPMTDASLIRMFFTHPLLTLKVIGGIHWEAVRLWVKGARFHRRPEPPAHDHTVLDERTVTR